MAKETEKEVLKEAKKVDETDRKEEEVQEKRGENDTLLEEMRADYERIAALAAKHGKSVSDYISALENDGVEERRKHLLEICGGNTEFAEHVLSLERENEKKAADTDLEEVKKFFPEFDTADKLPAIVVQAAALKGTKLLDEYLRYCLKEQRARETNEKSLKNAQKSAVGSCRYSGRGENNAHAEFLRGIWSR